MAATSTTFACWEAKNEQSNHRNVQHLPLPCTWQELTLNHPNIVNAKKNMELNYGPQTFLGAHL